MEGLSARRVNGPQISYSESVLGDRSEQSERQSDTRSAQHFASIFFH